MEDEIRSRLSTKLFQPTGEAGAGCINSGKTYKTDNGCVFVKMNMKPGADIMFQGEYHGLKALKEFLNVPNPILFGQNYLVLQHISFSNLDTHSNLLGKQLAHLHESRHMPDSKIGSDSADTAQFGFSVPTCCGFLPISNDWHNDWVEFYGRQRLQPLVTKIQEEEGNRDVGELWSHLSLKLSCFFAGITVVPALLHGDLWSGNAAQTKDGPVVYDPAAFYGHSEFDLAIARMFGGFRRRFYDAYHEILPPKRGFEERHQLYLLFHHLNHWAHFGSGYRNSSLNIMRNLIDLSSK